MSEFVGSKKLRKVQGVQRLCTRVHGVGLSYLVFGGVGPPALLLHGLYGRATEWRLITNSLSQSHEVFALDQRGHGRSDKGLADFSRDAQVNDVVEMIEALNCGPVLLVGQSMGGVTAFLTAALRPDLVERLIIIEALSHGDDRPEDEPEQPWINRWPLPFPTLDSARDFFRSQNENPDIWVEVLQHQNDAYWPEFYLEDMAAASADLSKPYDYRLQWSSIECHTLVVGGACSWLDQTEMKRMASAIQHGSYVTVEDARHDVHFDNPEGLVSAIRTFLKNS